MQTDLVDTNQKYEWPGWSLSSNPYGEQFDLKARKRMVQGSRELLPFIQKYKNHLGNKVLEVGPFFIPLITPETFPNTEITYWDNDQDAVSWLSNIPGVKANLIDINNLHEIKDSQLEFTSVVASQVFNYVDFKRLISYIHEFLQPGGLFFINNVNQYGLPSLFSSHRPFSTEEIKGALMDVGFTIIEEEIIKTQNLDYQKEPRLLFVAKK